MDSIDLKGDILEILFILGQLEKDASKTRRRKRPAREHAVRSLK